MGKKAELDLPYTGNSEQWVSERGSFEHGYSEHQVFKAQVF
jgi:hypothetical protein